MKLRDEKAVTLNKRDVNQIEYNIRQTNSFMNAEVYVSNS